MPDLPPDEQRRMAEAIDLIRRLWREEDVSWSGRFRPPLESATTLPRPFAGAPRIWHGSATTLTSAALAGKWGDPLFSANAIQPRANYKVLIDHYREEYARNGHDPRFAYLGSGSGGTFIADTTQQAKEQYGPIYEALVAGRNVPGNNTPFRDIDHAIAEGPALVGSPQQVIDKILDYHESFGHDLQSISLPTTLPFEDQLHILERLATEVIPVVRQAAPTTLWTDQDPYGQRPAFTGAQQSDAAAVIQASSRRLDLAR